MNMLNTFKRTQNGLLQASAFELAESGHEYTLKQFSRLHADKTRS